MADDADLIEQIAQKLHEVDPISGHDPRWDRLLKMDREWYRIKVAAVLPVLRRAQADAWDEGQDAGWEEAQDQWATEGMVGDSWKWADAPNPYREETP